MNVAVLSGPIPLAHQSFCFLPMFFRVTLLASAFEGRRAGIGMIPASFHESKLDGTTE